MAYLISAGHTNLIVNAYGGQNSLSAYEDLTNLFTIGTPKKILWCLGMNDADSSTAVNANWLNIYNSVKSLCESNNIELILATIPTVPTRINKYKNEIVRNSGYRYIDFDKAVGANEATGVWFGDMLYSDGVHPSETGALALYHQAIADMPELLNC
jgi:lysophospholipase L1-like esterase